MLPIATHVAWSVCLSVTTMHRMINQCLQSVFTQVNFFIHNLAQMKFSGHDDSTLLSFIPKTYRYGLGRIARFALILFYL